MRCIVYNYKKFRLTGRVPSQISLTKCKLESEYIIDFPDKVALAGI